MRQDTRHRALGGACTTTVLTDPAEFAALRSAWDDLYDRCASATPFQSHAWLASWWRGYGGPHELCVVVLRRPDRLLAALPLVRSRRWGYRVLEPLGAGLSDYTDVLVDDEEAAELLPAMGQALLRLPDWDVMDFPEVRPGAAVESLYAGWARRGRRMTASSCLTMPAVPLNEQVAAMSGRAAGKLRRHLRKIDELDLRITQVRPPHAPSAMLDLLRLHSLQWSERGINQEHLLPRFQEHLVRSAVQLIGSGQATLTEFRIGDRLVAADFSLVGTDFSGGYLYGADPWLRTQADTFAMIMQQALRHASARGLRTVSMLRGAEPHKAKWGAIPVESHRLIFARTTLAAGYMAMVSVRGRTARLVKRRFPTLARFYRARQSAKAVPSEQ